jgi:hypothetical protein
VVRQTRYLTTSRSQFTEHPKFKALIMRRTFADNREGNSTRQHEWYAPMELYIMILKTLEICSLIGHAEREQDVRKYDSLSITISIGTNQRTSLGFSTYTSASAVVDLVHQIFQLLLWSFTNPGNVGHSFFKERL